MIFKWFYKHVRYDCLNSSQLYIRWCMVYEYFSIVWIVLRYALMMVYEIWYNFYEKLRCDKWFVFKLWYMLFSCMNMKAIKGK